MNEFKRFLLGELIGEQVRVAKSGSKGLQGLQGKIVDETKNTFLIRTKKGRKVTIPKAFCSFEFRLGTAEGKLLAYRPEDRTKALAKKMKRKNPLEKGSTKPTEGTL